MKFDLTDGAQNEIRPTKFCIEYNTACYRNPLSNVDVEE
jgi:hypothetical protein